MNFPTKLQPDQPQTQFPAAPAATDRRDSGGATVMAATYHRRNFKISNN
jgi:hypothetical protein